MPGDLSLFDGIRLRMKDVAGTTRIGCACARVPPIAAGMMVLVGIVASQQVMATLGVVQEERLRELARLHVDGLTVALGPAVLRRDVWEVYDTLDRATQAMAGQRLVLTVVADEAGRVIAASDPLRAPVDSLIEPLRQGAQPVEAIRLTGAEPHVRVKSDLVFQGRTVGRILSELDVSDLVAERRRVLLWLLAGNTMATLILSAGGYLAVVADAAPRGRPGGAHGPRRRRPRGDPRPPDPSRGYRTGAAIPDLQRHDRRRRRQGRGRAPPGRAGAVRQPWPAFLIAGA